MKTQIYILLAVVSILVCNVRADLIWNSGHHVFSGGSEDSVEMYLEATAEITGGWISELRTYDNTLADTDPVLMFRINNGKITKIYSHIAPWAENIANSVMNKNE